MQFNQNIKYHSVSAFVSSLLVLSFILAAYFTFEPAVVAGQGTTREFTVTQTIDGEIAFSGGVNNVTMSPSIPGITGGTSNGSTTFAVNTNNPDGYTVEIEFANATSAMRFTGGPGNIPNFGGTVQTNFEPNVPANAARFGFTIAGPNVDTRFLDNGGVCNDPGGASTTNTCWWLGDTTGGTVIVDSDATANAEQHTLYFRVHVNANPSPSLELGTYVATATLTAIDKP
jgi:hypothetical protein